MRFSEKTYRHLLSLGVLFAAGALLLIIQILLWPRIVPIEILNNGRSMHVMNSLARFGENDNIQVTFRVDTRSILPLTAVRISVDECLQSMSINGVMVRNAALPYCNWGKDTSIDIGDLIQGGQNTIVTQISNSSGVGRIDMQPDGMDISNSVFAFLYMLLIFMWAFLIRRHSTTDQRIYGSVIVLGILLRMFYAVRTGFNVRAYDVDGHLEYIDFVSSHWSIPIGKAGWEFHQQPLYYFFGAALEWVLRQVHLEAFFIPGLQAASLIMSILTLLAAAWIVFQLFPQKSRGYFSSRLTFLLLIATLPNWVIVILNIVLRLHRAMDQHS